MLWMILQSIEVILQAAAVYIGYSLKVYIVILGYASQNLYHTENGAHPSWGTTKYSDSIFFDCFFEVCQKQ